MLLAAAAVLMAIAGLWWRVTYLLSIAVIVWVALGRSRKPPPGYGREPPRSPR